VQIGIGRLEALQLGVDGSELLSQKKCLLLLREGLVYGRGNFRADFGNGKLLCQHVCDMLETQRRRPGGEKSYNRNRAGISKLFLTPDIISKKVLLLLWRLRGSRTSMPRIRTNGIKEEI
jgi:hypothetical protein